MNWIKILPSKTTLVLFLLMVAVWLPIHTDWLDYLGEPFTEVAVIVLLVIYIGLCGVYGAIIAMNCDSAKPRYLFLLTVCVRTALLGGLASAVGALSS